MVRGLSVASRLAIIAATATAVVALGYWGFQPSEPDTVYLLGGQEFSELQLQSLSQALQAEGLAEFRIDGARLRVPRQQLAQYAAALAKRDALPAGFYSAFDKAVEKTSWWSSSTQDDRRWELARQKALAQIIEQMPEVESANVIIDRSAPRGPRAGIDVRATVSVKPRGGRELPPYKSRQIRNIVHGSVANMPVENVTVIDLNGKDAPDPANDADGSDDLLARMKEFEEHYTQKIRGTLAYIPDVLVTVNVELETTRQRRTEQLVWPRSDESHASDHSDAETQVTPTVTANAAVELPTPGDTTGPAETRPTQQQTWEEHVALAPKSVSVAIAVPHEVATSLAAGTTLGQNDAGWQQHIKELAATAIPSGITTRISVESYPARIDRVQAGLTATPGSSATPRVAWTIAGATASLLVVFSSVVCLRWQQARRVRNASGSQRFHHAAATDDIESLAAPRAVTRELVRVEQSSRVRTPHLAQAKIHSFEDLRRLAPASMQAALGEVASRLWAPALRGASRELCERVLNHMPSRAATLLREEIECPGPVRLGDVEAAQQEILEVVRRLDHTGDLILEDREEVHHE